MKSKNLRELKPEFIRLYTEEKKSIREIARIYNIDKSSVSRYIHEDVKPRKRGLDDEQKEMAKILYESGYTLRGIADELNASNCTVKSFLVREFGELRTSRTRRYEHLVDDFVADYKAGLSSWEISEKYNVSPSTILNYISEKDVKVRSYCESSFKYEANNDYFDVLDEHKSYILGLILGGASNYKRSSMKFIDIRTAKTQEHLLDVIQDEIYTSDKPSKNDFRNTVCIRIHSKKIVDKIIEIKDKLISGKFLQELECFKEVFFSGFIEMSRTDIEKGICIRIFKDNIDALNNFISSYYKITKINEDTKNIFLGNENRKVLGFALYKDYTVYKVGKKLNSNSDKLLKDLNIKEDSYIIYFHKDNINTKIESE